MIKWAVIAIVLVLLIAGGFWRRRRLSQVVLCLRAMYSDLSNKKKLQQDANGRTNILVLGTSEDDPGHDGAHLTDSIMIFECGSDK